MDRYLTSDPDERVCMYCGGYEPTCGCGEER